MCQNFTRKLCTWFIAFCAATIQTIQPCSANMQVVTDEYIKEKKRERARERYYNGGREKGKEKRKELKIAKDRRKRMFHRRSFSDSHATCTRFSTPLRKLRSDKEAPIDRRWAMQDVTTFQGLIHSLSCPLCGLRVSCKNWKFSNGIFAVEIVCREGCKR
jgi:hypothetical protein